MIRAYAILCTWGLINLRLLDSRIPQAIELQALLRTVQDNPTQDYFLSRNCVWKTSECINLRLRGGSDLTKSIVGSIASNQIKEGKELNIDSFWCTRGLSDVTPWLISELDQKRQNKTLTSFEADLDNLLILERKLQRNKKFRRQCNGSVIESEIRFTEENLDALYTRIAAAESTNQSSLIEDLRQAAETAARRRDALSRLLQEVAMERRYSKVKQVVLRDDDGRAALTALEHSRWLDLVDGPGMDDGEGPPRVRGRSRR